MSLSRWNIDHVLFSIGLAITALLALRILTSTYPDKHVYPVFSRAMMLASAVYLDVWRRKRT